MSKKPTPAEGVEAPAPTPGADDQAITIPPSKSTAPAPATKDEREYTGELLKQLREAQHITLKEMSDRTKITVPVLNSLEEERFDTVPQARVYVRGFVRCIALELGLDQEQVSKTYLPRWERWNEQRHQAKEPQS